jgi:hypothetical protein
MRHKTSLGSCREAIADAEPTVVFIIHAGGFDDAGNHLGTFWF